MDGIALDTTNPDRLLATEYLLTNGLGGFSMGTAAGVPSRRYHALLIGATQPPVGRIAALNAVAERLLITHPSAAASATASDRALSIDLSTFRFAPGATLHPDGLSRLVRFEHTDTCRWTFEAADQSGAPIARIAKILQLLDAESACTVTYRLERINTASNTKTAPSNLELRLRPLVSLRDMHELIRHSWADTFQTTTTPGGVCVSRDQHTLHITTDAARARGSFTLAPDWWYNFYYTLDASRGQDHTEDLFSPGEFSLTLPASESTAECTLQASFKPLAHVDRNADRQRRAERIAKMTAAALAHTPLTAISPNTSTTELKSMPARASAAVAGTSASDDRIIHRLCAAADQFIVARQSPTTRALDQSSIIAGYPWFADWGRDTSIAITGLMLMTGRHDEARRTLTAFASHRRRGLIPNVFDDRTGEPEYNTVDASLWFIHACCTYLDVTRDASTFTSLLAPACLDIIAHYRKGTDFNIAMDPMDKLITAGSASTQLTWMDARRDGVTFTPRHGKAVEINALWHSALRELSRTLAPTDSITSANIRELADSAARSFRSAFVHPSRPGLYDGLTPIDSGSHAAWQPIDEIRPNQIFAVSLPHSPLPREQQFRVVESVRTHLLTPMGLRTLAPGSPNYRPRYEGTLFERDSAYHNGTAWPWLLGPFAEALLRVADFSAAAKAEARAALQPLIDQMSCPWPGPCNGHLGCLNQIAEIYDAEPPQRPQGCTAQAWSVAETLRVWILTR
jgi:glycogen debranching enzyme